MNLEQELLLIKELEAKDSSLRLNAIEQAIKHGGSRELLEALQNRCVVEENPECLLLLEQAISIIQGRLTGTPFLVPDKDEEDFLNAFRNLGPPEKISRLECLSPAQVKSFAPSAPVSYTHLTLPTIYSV